MPLRAPPRGIPWTPNAERGRRLRAWFDASDGNSVERSATYGPEPARNVVRWRDLSGYGLHTTRIFNVDANNSRWGQRRQNGLPMISQDGENNECLPRGAGTAGFNTYGIGAPGFIVAGIIRADQWINGGLDDGSGSYFWDRSVTGDGNPLWSLKMCADQLCVQIRNNSGMMLSQSPLIASVVSGRPMLVVTRYCQFNRDPESYGFRAWIAGALVSALTGAWGDIAVDPVQFGYNSGTGGPSFLSIGEYLFFNDGEDMTLRERVEGYLAHKWGIRLPTSHPYATRPPTRVAR